MKTKGPLNPASGRHHYNNVIVDRFIKYLVTGLTSKYDAHYAVNALLHCWVSQFGLPRYLITDRRTKDIHNEITKRCSVFQKWKFSMNFNFCWGYGFNEEQKKIVQHIYLFTKYVPRNNPKSRCTQFHFFADGNNTQPMSNSNVSPCENVFHTQRDIRISVHLSLSGNQPHERTTEW